MSATTFAPAVRPAMPRRAPSRGRRPAAGARPVNGRPAPHGQLRLTRRGRAVVWLLGAALSAGLGGAAVSASADGPDRATEVRRIVVAPGETLWAIAADVAGPGEDVRDVVLQLMELNRLDSGGLRVGQQVIVPVG